MTNANLITTAGVKELGLIQANVRDSILEVVIRRAQDFMVRPILGTSFFERLKEGIVAGDLNSDEIALLNNYIAPFITACCDGKAINALTLELRAETAGKAKDEHIEPLNAVDSARLFDDIDESINGYKDILIGFLKDNCDLFPTYKEYICSFENVKPEQPSTRTRVRFS